MKLEKSWSYFYFFLLSWEQEESLGGTWAGLHGCAEVEQIRSATKRRHEGWGQHAPPGGRAGPPPDYRAEHSKPQVNTRHWSHADEQTGRKDSLKYK